jgi:Protein of unknown function (DUF2950)
MKNKFAKCPGRSLSATLAPIMFAILVFGYAQVCLAASPNQTTFPSAEAGSRALFLAVQQHDEQALTKMLGTGADLVNSDDAVQDSLDRQQFIQKYQQMHRLAREPDGDTILYIGAENWPFPIPLVSQDGVWRFDPDAGRQEVLFRRIGENEVAAIETCRNLAQIEHQPATRDKSDSATGTLLAELESNKGPVSLDAYNFRLLTGQSKTADGNEGATTGGFALIAYPAAYRMSGVMSFIVDQKGIVYQKDLGLDTAKLAATMTGYRPDPTWTPVPSEP